MPKLLRTLLVCLLVLALPAQAALAAAQAYCAAHHRGLGVVAAQPAADAMPAAAAHGEACAHGAAGDAGALADAVPAEAEAVPADAACCGCGACGAPASLPALVHRLPPAETAPTSFSPAEAAVEAFASGGPDRPPRSLLG